MITVLRGELTILAAQRRVRALLALCAVAPWLLALAVQGSGPLPRDTLYGRWLRDSGFATPLLILGFVGAWALPALVGIVAGDVFSREDRQGTWPMMLTRSRTRAQLFWGKLLAAALWTVVLVLLLTASSLLAGLVVVGDQPLVGLSGQLLSGGHLTGLVLLSWACALAPALTFAALAIVLSVGLRSSPAGIGAPVVVGLVAQIVGQLGILGGTRLLLPGAAFDSWHGLLLVQPDLQPLVEGLVVSAAYTVVIVLIARRLLLRREL
jgi:ABC-2 type transport system permease protein